MKNYNILAHQGSTEIFTLKLDEGTADGATIKALVKRSKDGKTLAKFKTKTDGDTITLTLLGEDTAKIELINDVDVFAYDVFIGDLCVLYGKIRMRKAVSLD